LEATLTNPCINLLQLRLRICAHSIPFGFSDGNLNSRFDSVCASY
jgi:hypothetical protein